MKIIGWNVNGIRAAEKKGFYDWMKKMDADMVCLQETKAHPEQLSEAMIKPFSYHSFWASAEKKGYSGVVIYTKTKPKDVKVGLGIEEFDKEGRTVLAFYDQFVLINTYFPNGGDGNKRVPFKMQFYDAYLKMLKDLRKKGHHIIITGDVNTAHEPIDLARPKENEKNTGFLPEERAWVSQLLGSGFVDTFRYFHKDPGNYTWWDYKTGARARNVGWRIDYFFVDQDFLPKVKDAQILSDVMGSDHCPISLEIK